MWLTRKLAAFTSPLDRNQVTTKRLVFHEDTKHNSNLSRTTTNSSSLSSTAFDPVVKPLPRTPDSTPIITNGENQNELVIVLAGAPNIGKSQLLSQARKLDDDLCPALCNVDGVTYRIQMVPISISKEHDSSISDNDDDDEEYLSGFLNSVPDVIHGALICYDVANQDSMNCLPDLLNTFVSRDIPSFLVGLTSKPSSQTTIDPSVVKRLADFFSVEFFHIIGNDISAFSSTMKEIYSLLVRRCIFQETTTMRASKRQETTAAATIARSSSSQITAITESNEYRFPVTGFVYAPTTTSDSPNMEIKANFSESPPPPPPPPPSYYLNARRGSKDSCESVGGLTTDDIIDRLLSSENTRADEHMLTVFVTFFRKFMKPSELAQNLIERFEDEEAGVEDGASKPTAVQERIFSVFVTWLSFYWNDFTSSKTRKIVVTFLDRLSACESLRPMCDVLAPLIIREPPLDDPDMDWGMTDSDDDDDDQENKHNEKKPSTVPFAIGIPSRNKKDSGYASASFSVVNSLLQQQQQQQKPLPQSAPMAARNSAPPTPKRPLVRTVSTGSFSGFPYRPSTRQRSRTESNAQRRTPLTADDGDQGKMLRRTEFGGGCVYIDYNQGGDTTEKEGEKDKEKPEMSVSPSWASVATLVSTSTSTVSLVSAKAEKDYNNFVFKTMMEISSATFAEQLTWIEMELFKRIKPRDFVRNIWSTNVKSNNNSTVASSVAHFNFISAWVATMIVTQAKLQKRAALLEKFVSIAVELRNLNNYNSLMAVLAGLNSAPVLRLKQAREAIADKKIYKQFQSLDRLMSSDRSFSSYRLALKVSEAPGIPYLGIHNQDLLSLAEANKDFRPDGTIHWDKFRLMGDCILAMTKFQQPSYRFQPDAKLLKFIADSEILSEDEQYRRSTLVEPRLKSSASTNKLRDLWMRL